MEFIILLLLFGIQIISIEVYKALFDMKIIVTE